MPFNRKDGDLIEIRPRFKLLSKLDADTISQNLSDGLKDDKTITGKKVIDIFYLDIPKAEQKYWSPALRASLEKNEAGEGTLIRVVIGPRYNVWVFFVFMYTLLSLLCLFGGMYGMVQWNLGIDSLWIYCFPVVAVLILTVFLIAKIGQRATRDEMLHLSSFLYHHIKDDNLERIN